MKDMSKKYVVIGDVTRLVRDKLGLSDKGMTSPIAPLLLLASLVQQVFEV